MELKMLHEVMNFFRLNKEFRNIDYFDTEKARLLCKEVQTLIESRGQLIALTGIIGSGKTTLCENIRQAAQRTNKVMISNSWAVEKNKVSIGTLMAALSADLSSDKKSKLPNRAEERERKLCELIKKKGKPVALFIDESHELNSKTLFGLKKLIEVVSLNGGNLSIVLVGLPKLTITLKNPSFEEIGTRIKQLTVDVVSGQEKEFITWMLEQCIKPKIKPSDVFEQAAINLLAEKLRTPLQICYYAWQSLEIAHKIGERPVSVSTVRTVLAPNLNALEVNLVRQGFSEKVLSELLDIKPREVRAFLKGQLPHSRTEELHYQLLCLGIIQTATG